MAFRSGNTVRDERRGKGGAIVLEPGSRFSDADACAACPFVFAAPATNDRNRCQSGISRRWPAAPGDPHRFARPERRAIAPRRCAEKGRRSLLGFEVFTPAIFNARFTMTRANRTWDRLGPPSGIAACRLPIGAARARRHLPYPRRKAVALEAEQFQQLVVAIMEHRQRNCALTLSRCHSNCCFVIRLSRHRGGAGDAHNTFQPHETCARHHDLGIAA
jgi:hypothetical protein